MGKFAGGVINMSTKSGTNTWHGEAYEYIRNKVLNANEFFNKQNELAHGNPNKPVPFTQNQFGGAGSGAIIKNKTFVFGSYEGFRLRQGTPFNTTVPTAQERQGDFSDLCTGDSIPAVFVRMEAARSIRFITSNGHDRYLSRSPFPSTASRTTQRSARPKLPAWGI